MARTARRARAAAARERADGGRASLNALPPFELGYARTELRRELVEAVLRGEKTTTSGLAELFEAKGEPVPESGDRYALLDFDDEPVAVVQIDEARVVPASAIDVQFAHDEGEGFETVEGWRTAHERFFDLPIDSDTRIVAIRFHVVE